MRLSFIAMLIASFVLSAGCAAALSRSAGSLPRDAVVHKNVATVIVGARVIEFEAPTTLVQGDCPDSSERCLFLKGQVILRHHRDEKVIFVSATEATRIKNAPDDVADDPVPASAPADTADQLIPVERKEAGVTEVAFTYTDPNFGAPMPHTMRILTQPHLAVIVIRQVNGEGEPVKGCVYQEHSSGHINQLECLDQPHLVQYTYQDGSVSLKH